MGAQWPTSAFHALNKQVSPLAQRCAAESRSKGSQAGIHTGINPGPPKYGEASVVVKSVWTERGNRHVLPAWQSLPLQFSPGARGPAAAENGCSWRISGAAWPEGSSCGVAAGSEWARPTGQLASR